MAFREVDDLRQEINGHLRTFLSHHSMKLLEISPALEKVGVGLSEFILSSGKRLRPLFAYAGFVAAGAEPGESELRAMASLELLQACALIHDDVMDRSDTRRGKPSIHKIFEQTHVKEKFSGSAELYGEASAILIGDLALVWSDLMLHSSKIDTARLLSAIPVHDEMRVELMAGQFLDVHEQGQRDWSAERALKIARFKSGKYTIERPLHFGAALANGSADLMSALSAFGLPLGEAFQLRDDLLGVFGDPEVTGKPAGDDLREGKRTVLIAFVDEALSPQQRENFYRLFGRSELTFDEVEELRSIISASGANTRIEELIAHLTSQSLSALEADAISSAAAEFMRPLVQMATRRSA